MSLKKKIIINIGSNWAGTLVTIVAGVVIVPLVLSQVKAEGYGVWALLAGGLSYVAILDRALLSAVNRFVAYAGDDVEQRNGYISASFFILTGFAVISIVGISALSFFVADVFRSIPPHLAREAQVTCVLVGFTFACKMIGANFTGALMGYQSYVRSNAVLVCSNLMRIVFTAGLLFFWKSIIAVQAAFLMTAGMSLILMYVMAKWTISGFLIRRRFVTRRIFCELFRYTSHSFARSGSMVVMFNTMTLLVGFFGTAVDVAAYDIAIRLPQIARGIVAGMQNVFLPTISNLCGKGEHARIKALITKGTWMSAILTGFILVLMFFFVDDVLHIWLHGNVPEKTPQIMKIAIISVIPCGLFDIWLPALVAIGHLTGLTIISISIAAAGVGLAAALMLSHALPVPMAAALALLIALVLRSGICLPVLGMRKMGLNAYLYLRTALASPLFAAALSAIVLWALNPILLKWNVHLFIRLPAAAVIVGSIYLIFVLGAEVTQAKAVLMRRFSLKERADA